MKILILAVTLLSPPQTIIDCPKDAQGYCAGGLARIELTYQDSAPKVRVNVAMGRMTDIILPANTELTRNAGIGNLNLFNVRMIKEGVIRVIPTPPTDLPASAFFGEDTNLLIPLDGISINLVLRIHEVKRHTPEVHFIWKERQKEAAYVQKKYQELKESLEKQHEKRLSNISSLAAGKVELLLATSFLERLQCNQWNRVIFKRQRDADRLLILWVDQLCRIGQRVMISFRLLNRYRDIFHLKEVKVLADEVNDVKAHWIFAGGQKKISLGMNDEVHGVAYFQVATPPAAEFTLIVKEDGGKQRLVELDGIEF